MTLGICTLISWAVTIILALITGGFKQTDPTNRISDCGNQGVGWKKNSPLEKLSAYSSMITVILTILWITQQ